MVEGGSSVASNSNISAGHYVGWCKYDELARAKIHTISHNLRKEIVEGTYLLDRIFGQSRYLTLIVPKLQGTSVVQEGVEEEVEENKETRFWCLYRTINRLGYCKEDVPRQRGLRFRSLTELVRLLPLQVKTT